MKRTRSYIICTSPRSGSTLLCKLLAATGQSGDPDSHFHRPSLTDWMDCYEIEPDDAASERDLLAAIFQAARDRGTGDTGMFGLRLQRESFDFLMQQLAILAPELACDMERIEKVFGCTSLIHLARQSKLDQAISLVKALQTGLWHRASDGTELERTSEPREPVYDADAIAHHLSELTSMDACWNAWFARERLEPFRVSYDDLSAAPAAVLAGVLDHLGLDPGIASDIVPPVAKLADVANERWARRFLAERGVPEAVV